MARASYQAVMQLIDIAKGQFGGNVSARERVFPRDASIDRSREFSGKRLISAFRLESKVMWAMRKRIIHRC